MRITVVDFAGGNLASAARAVAAAAERSAVAATVEVTSDPSAIRRADRIVLPGQGAFADCRRGLDAVPGLVDAIEDRTAQGAPYLGICVGMQLMATRGLEHGTTDGFGWLRGDIDLMRPDPRPTPAGDPGADTPLRLPQIGWNTLRFDPSLAHPLLHGILPGDHFYFVHSYALCRHDPDDVLATTDYAGERPALVCRGNRAGTQFHVEKSQEVGLRLLANFLAWTP